MKADIHITDNVNLKATFLDQDNNVVDISTATTKEIWLMNPNGETDKIPASFFTDGTDGVIEYTTDESDFDITGIWKVQGYVVIGESQWHSDVKHFPVLNNL